MVLGILISAAAAVVPTIIYVLIFYWADRFEREPLSLLVIAFLWGAVPAVVVSLIGELLLGAPFVNAPGSLSETLVEGALVAPILEEIAKGLALLFLFRWKRQEFDGVLDGLLYGALVGFGFAMTENFFYFVGAFVDGGFVDLTVLIFLRSLLFGLNHAFYTGLTGIGLGLARNARSAVLRAVLILAGFAAATVTHALHNLGAGLTSVSPVAFLLSLLVATGGAGVIVVVVLLAWHNERRCIESELAEEVGLLVTADEFSQLTGRWRMPLMRRSALNQRMALCVELALRKRRLRMRTSKREPELLEEIQNIRRRLGELAQT